MKILTDNDIQLLVDNNSAPPYKERNIAVLFGALYWGLTPSELSLIELHDVMNDRGRLFQSWYLPGEYTRSGQARPLGTDGIMIKVVENYLGWLKRGNHSQSSRHTYRGFQPDSKLFLNDRGQSYALTVHSKHGGYVPRSMHDFLKRMIANTGLYGVTPSQLRDSYINELYRRNLGIEEIKLTSGYKTTATIEKKIRLSTLADAFKEVFRYVNV